MDKPWLITIGADGQLREHGKEEAVPMIRRIVASHAQHGGIFFVPECPECQAAYGSKGERWADGEPGPDEEPEGAT